MLSGGKHHSAAYAMELLVQSYSRSLQEKKPALVPPEIVGLKQHRYE